MRISFLAKLVEHAHNLCTVNVPHLSVNVKKLMNVSLFKQVHHHSSNGCSHILSYRYTALHIWHVTLISVLQCHTASSVIRFHIALCISFSHISHVQRLQLCSDDTCTDVKIHECAGVFLSRNNWTIFSVLVWIFTECAACQSHIVSCVVGIPAASVCFRKHLFP